MFEMFQSFFQSLSGTRERDGAGVDPDDPRLAVAALCIQVMEADGTVSSSEIGRLRSLLHDHYGLEGKALDAMIAAGETAGHEAVDYHRFTSELKRHLDEEQRLELIGILWDIVYADGRRSEMEDHVIWRIADLMGVDGRDRITLRQAAALRAPPADPDES